MKIPQQLRHFGDAMVLFIVTGKQDAVLYRVHDDVVDRMMAFKIPTPHYSDNEGHFKTRSQGGVVRSGTLRERRDDTVIGDFLHEFKHRVKEIHDDYHSIYIFAPNRTKHKVPDLLPDSWQKKEPKVIEGNYCSRSPLFLIEKVKSMEEKPSIPHKPEAKKILKISDQARTV